MGLWVCGDTHGHLDIRKLNTEYFPMQKNMTKKDYVLILGDFGLVWDYNGISREEKNWLNWLNSKNFTTLFIDGNHENFARLNTEYPIIDFCGGKAHQIYPSIYHLMRGEIFELAGTKCFIMGGAASHDIRDGIIDPSEWEGGIHSEGFRRKIKEFSNERKSFRVKGTEWWEEEMPTSAEMLYGVKNLAKVNNKVDFVFTHCAPTSIIAQMGFYDHDQLTDYFDTLSFCIEYKEWHFGHYHQDRKIAPNFYCHYRNASWRLA